VTASPKDSAAVAQIEPLAGLLRRFAVDFLTGQAWNLLPAIMAPDYTLNVGGHAIAGREEGYRLAMRAAFSQFPGLCVTVHDVVLAADAIAMRFTEHGVSVRDAGRCAAWQGVSLFRVGDGLMQVGWAEEDYLARKRQLRSGRCDVIEAPHCSPWDVRVQPSNPSAEAIALGWLRSGGFYKSESVASAATSAGVCPDPEPHTLIRIESVTVDELFSAGDRVVFHATAHGTYAGGYADVPADLAGQRAVLRAAGMVTVSDNAVVDARVVTDRLGMQRALQPR
jgi:predicted ester cyclase